MLEPGRFLLHYRLIDKIGEGGMGVVWRAVDTTLDREVAIKLLPESVAASHERLLRFEREAKLLASLNHPNIAAVYGLHEAGGLRFLAMELVPGEDLAQRLKRGPLGIDEALPAALQIAEALELAHEHGVVHRDLKPANIRETPEGKVKVLDFGLAKALESAASDTSGARDSAASPTITSAGTVPGVILGTAAYMSPEQARGRSVDRRADIWAFGCVLFELLTAHRAFPGETVSDTLVAVLSTTPDWSALPATAGPTVRRLLERCLTKDPRRRLRDIGEARITIEDALRGEPPAVQERIVVPRRRPWLSFAVAAAGLLAFGAGWLLRGNDAGGAGGVDADVRVRRLTFTEGLSQEPSLSPDGNYVAYATDESGNLDIVVMPLAGGNVSRVVDHPADDVQPRWSPDGSKLAFVSARDRGGLLTVVGGLGAFSPYVTGNGGDIFLIPALGGLVTKLVEQAFYPSWSPDGREIAFLSNRGGEWDIWHVPVAGGDPIRLTDDMHTDFQPAWSPDGSWIAYGSANSDGSWGLYVVPAGGGARIEVLAGAAIAPAWSPDGHWIYFASDRAAAPGWTNLWRVRFHPGRSAGPPERVTIGEGSDVGVAVSADGTRLAFGAVRFAPDVWRLDVADGQLTRITSAASSEEYPHLAVDGHRVIFQSDRGGAERLWSLDLRDNSLLQIQTPGSATFPRWSPDGTRIAYQERRPEGDRLIIQRWGDVTTQILATAGGVSAPQWSPDGQRLAGAQSGIWVHTPGQPSVQRTREFDGFPTWSPDGREIAFQREVESGVREIWIVPADSGEPRLLAGGRVEYSHPQWCPTDPDRILVVIDHKDLGIVRVSTGEVERITRLAASTIVVDYPSWSPDGRSVYFGIGRKTGDVYLLEGLSP